ncbi:MAG TPA: cysteine desulfurase family protein [Acidimicrobiales bacterium]|nr:cysteine desulfurase family protein [Acidimicrobiales bacterium]
MPAYLDHAATTPLRPEATEAMRPFLAGERFGNPSGSHAVARAARTAVDEARDIVAECLGCKPGEVVFTAGGTEADNLAVLGVHAARPGPVLCSTVEHHAVLHAVEAVGGRAVDLGDLAHALAPGTTLVSVMLVNNEVGTIHPLDDIVEVVRRVAPDALVHTDAVQAFSWLDVAATTADLVAISAHKFGGPQGVGALVVREGARLAPILHGGGQERERRSGTHNVAGIVGMAAAMRATVESRRATNERVADLRDRLADGLLAAVPGAVETGDRAAKVPGNCHMRFPGTESEALLLLLDEHGVCASAGSACASGAIEPSHVLTAMGLSREEALSSVRFSLGWTSSDADVDLALRVVPEAVERLRR